MSDDTAAKYLASLNAQLKTMRELYGSKAIVTTTDPTTVLRFTRQPATVTTTCARCSATIDPAAVEQHHERCFVVGDWVRWSPDMTPGNWVEGEVTVAYRGMARAMRVQKVSRDPWYAYPQRPPIGSMVDPSCYPSGLRHIQRPGQAVRSCCPGATTGHVCGCDPIETRAAAYHKLASEAPGPIGCAHGEDDDDELQDAYEAMEEFTPILPPEVDPLDIKYDGVTLRELVGMDVSARRELSNPIALPGVHTPAQRDAVSAHWSEQLRARISAAKERERLSVTYCEVDVDD